MQHRRVIQWTLESALKLHCALLEVHGVPQRRLPLQRGNDDHT